MTLDLRSPCPELRNEWRAKDVQETFDDTLSTETIDISKEDAEGDCESHLSNTCTLLRLAGSKVVDVKAEEDRRLLEDVTEGSFCLDDTREAGYSVIKQRHEI